MSTITAIKTNHKNTGSIKQPKTKYCLVIGFDAFGSDAFNPSQYIVETLVDNIKEEGSLKEVSVNTIILPVTGELAWQILQDALKNIPSSSRKSSVLILTGLFDQRSVISIERFALNILDYRIKDNLGRMIRDEPIDETGPAALTTDVRVRDIANHLLKKGFPAEVSNHAGTFICNETYYRALRFQQTFQYPQTVLFVHVPSPGKFGGSLRALGTKRAEKMARGRKNQLNAMRDAVIQIIQACYA
jgi:pyroglutamyl-peptidase